MQIFHTSARVRLKNNAQPPDLLPFTQKKASYIRLLIGVNSCMYGNFYIFTPSIRTIRIAYDPRTARWGRFFTHLRGLLTHYCQ